MGAEHGIGKPVIGAKRGKVGNRWGVRNHVIGADRVKRLIGVKRVSGVKNV